MRHYLSTRNAGLDVQENQRSYFLFLEFLEQNHPGLGSPATSIDMMESQNFPALDQAIGNYTTQDDNDLKAGLKHSLYYLLKTMATIVKGTFIVNHGDDKARVTPTHKFVVVLELKNASLSGGEGRVVSRHLTCVRAF